MLTNRAHCFPDRPIHTSTSVPVEHPVRLAVQCAKVLRARRPAKAYQGQPSIPSFESADHGLPIDDRTVERVVRFRTGPVVIDLVRDRVIVDLNPETWLGRQLHIAVREP